MRRKALEQKLSITKQRGELEKKAVAEQFGGSAFGI